MRNSKGFTLVELSIVIVIIGFLVAGVSAGTNMIETVKLKKVVTDFQTYDITVSSFKSQYGYLPGDIPHATSYWSNDCLDGGGPYTCNGNGDGVFTTPGDATFEGTRAFQHLALAKIIKGGYSGYGSYGISRAPGISTPLTPIDSGCYDYFNWGFGGPNIIFRFGSATEPNCNNPILKPAQALFIEEKIDGDNGYSTGKIFGLCLAGGRTVGPNDVYNLGNDNVLCRLILRLDVNKMN